MANKENPDSKSESENPSEPPFVFDDVGPRGQVGDNELEAFKRLLAAHPGLNFVSDSFEPDPEKSAAFDRFMAQTDGYKVRHDSPAPVLVGDEITPERVREMICGTDGYGTAFGIGVELLTPIDASDPNEPWSNAAIRRVLLEHPEIIHDFGYRGSKGMQKFLTDNPGVLLKPGPADYQLATYPDGHMSFVDSDGVVVHKMSLTSEQHAALGKMMEENSIPLVPVVVDGERVQHETIWDSELHARIKEKKP